MPHFKHWNFGIDFLFSYKLFMTDDVVYLKSLNKTFYNQLREKDEELKSVMIRCDVLASENPKTHKEMEDMKETIEQKDNELSEKEKKIKGYKRMLR